MSILDDYNAAKKKRKKEPVESTVVESDGSIMGDYYASKAKRESGTSNGSIGISDIAPLYSSLDIAPTVTTTKDGERTWFQKGATKDGVTAGNVAKAILGTVTDVVENVGSGALTLAENLVDTVAYLGVQPTSSRFNTRLRSSAEVAERAEKYRNTMESITTDFIKKDIIDEEKIAKTIISNPVEWLTGVSAEEDSFLGEKADSLAQSGGQLLTQAGLQALGVPWFVTAGVSTFGSEAENALNEGATFGEAGLSAAVSAGAEILTEKISGGIKFGGKTLDEGVTNLIASRISDKTVRTLVKLGVDMAGEGFEEILSGVMSAIGQKISYADDKELSELFSSEDAWESFIGGAVLGGASGVFQAGQSSKKGIDYTTGLTKNEQAVVDKLYKDLTKDVKSEKEKSKIYDEVLDQLEKGYISTDVIEEVLGGDRFNQYRDTVNNEDALIHEFEQLGKKQNATLEEQTRYQKLSGQVEDIKANSQRNQLKTQLSQEVFNLVKGDKLVESYNEKARRTQKYEADLTKYDVNQQKTIQKAIDSGVLNNTRRTHEFVDMVAKISADKGVLFDFTNNQKLKESGFALDGKVVNGYVTKDGITINTQSSRYINSVVGHEITHVLEGTEVYNELKKVLFQYAETKGEYKTRFDALSELYKDIKDADIEAELTADLVGDYLFTDQDFIKNLSVNNKTVFEKIYDEIKYLWKVATGTKEEKELAKVKRAFEEAYRARGKNQGTKYSLTEPFTDSNGARYDNAVLLDTDFFDGISPRNWGEKLRTAVNERAADNPFILPIADENGNTTLLQFASPEDRVTKDGASNHKVLDKLSSSTDNISKLAVIHIDEIVSVSEENSPYYTNENNHQWLDQNGWLHRNANVINQKNGNIYNLTVDIAKTADGRTILYATNGKIKKVGNVQVNSLKIKGSGQNSNFDNKVPQNANGVKLSISDSTANVNPTDDADIRFSLSEPIEQTKNLVALHNLTADKLSKSLELGGLPMPSLAITKADIPHSNFGEITLIFDRETIDPKKNKNNKVYSADAWTPVFQRTEYEADSNVGNRISQRLSALEPKIDDYFYQDLRRLQFGFDDYLNRQGGEEGLIQYAMGNYGLKAAYLEEQGKHIAKVTTQQEVEKGFNPDAADKYMKIMDILGVTTAEEIGKVNLKEARDNHGAELEEVYPGITKTAMRMGRLFNVVRSYIENKNSGPVYNTVTDGNATRQAVDEALDTEGFERWTRNLFSGIVKDSGIYNNKELFTPSGNRRSFKQTHLPVTLENIVKAMASQNDGKVKNVSGFNGIKTLRASTAETFKSVEEMHQRSGRLQNLTPEELKAVNDDLQSRLYKVIETIDNENVQRGETNPLMRFDTIGEILSEIGESGRYGVADIQNVFKQYSKTVSDDTALAVKQLLYDVTQMPVNIFEAKPQRVVGFDEAKAFVVPNNVDSKLKQELLNRGYPVAEYDPNVEGDRQRVVNQFEEYRFSLSKTGEQPKQYGRYNVSGEDIRLQEEVAPVQETVTDATQEANEMFPNDLAPIQSELSRLMEEKTNLEDMLYRMASNEEFGDEFNRASQRWDEVNKRIDALDGEMEESESGRIDSLSDSDVPPEIESTYSGKNKVTVDDPFENREWYDIGNRKVKAYMYENPEVKPYFQEEAMKLLGEFNDTTRGERWYNDELYYESGGENGFGGVKRHTSKSMETLLDSWAMSYDDIENGLKAIIEDNGAENIADAKKIEFMLNDRLLNGYQDFYTNQMVEPNQDYINLLNEKQINEYSKESFDAFMQSADQYAPVATDEYIAPVKTDNNQNNYHEVKTSKNGVPGQQSMFPVKENTNVASNTKTSKNGEVEGQQSLFPAKEANILTEEPKAEKTNKTMSWIKNNVIDKGMVFEDLSLATGNRELQARWNSIRYSDSKAQKLIGEGNAFTHSLNSIKESVEKTGKTKQFYEYLYHKHNIDRMTLEERFKDTPNKPVFGYTVTAEVSRDTVKKLERANPEFKQLSQDVYDYMNYLRELLVENGVISDETAQLWATMYPNYVPIRRAGDTGININVPLDTGRTGVNAPIKRATGGSRDILPLFDTMGQRTLQTYKAIAKNRFGVELKNTLNTEIAKDQIGVDETIENIDKNDGLLQEGKNGKKPTFTVFENGQRVTFEITDEMYDAMKPSDFKFNSKTLNKISDFRRATLTEYNPWFMLKNAVKDIQDVFINSQHSIKTYASIPKAIKQMQEKGNYYQEYIDNGGEQNSYFDSETNTFNQKKEIKGLSLISKANNIVEMLPRLAEYIASREMGRSVDVAMLDSARVTTNFAAGGDLTKMLNRNGFTFLNASVQGAMQQVRNIREAKMNGLRGWAGLAGKFVASGLPVVLLNHLIWDDDEEYEEVPDYVKQNYYIVGKFGDGQFVRIPKGRTVAVIQEAFNQMDNLVTGDDEVDMKSFIDLVISNLAPNNPLDNNILSPVVQTLTNTTWYGEDLVPTRLQDLPSAEQYDESTDVISKWLGETTNTSPYKWNYLLDQYSGVIGDTFLPMLTPEAESGDNTFLGNMIAPLKDMFTTDSVMNNQNVSEFYDLKDELTITANGSNATDEDKIKSKYINSISSSMSELYQQKREIQNSDLPDDEKYAQVRDIQQQIVDMMKEGMSNYQGITYEGEYARVGDRIYTKNEDGEWYKLSDEQALKYEVTSAAGDAPYATDGTNHYRWYVKEGETKGEWRKITDDQLEKQEEVTNGLHISPEEYWGNKEEYDYAYENPDNYAMAKAVGGYEAYRQYSSELYDIKSDKDEYGKSISGSRKEKVLDYINSLDADYYTKLILYKSEYTSYDDENMEIINYLNNREDISYDEMEAILLKLGFYVDSQGNISWD